MPNYGDYLSTNQQGLNNLASSAQLGLKQPTAVDRFMEGLRQAQEMRIQRQAAQGLANYRMGMVGARDEANDLKRQTNDANTKLKFLLTATKLGDPMRAAQALGAAEPENADMYASLATSARGASGMGIGAELEKGKNDATADLQGAQGEKAKADAAATEALVDPRIAELEARVKKYEHDAQRPYSVNIFPNNTKPAPGYRYTATGDLEPIPGGPADFNNQTGAAQAKASANSYSTQMDRLYNAANKLYNHPGLGRVTGVVGAFPDIPGGEAANARAKFDTLKSQVAFNVLQDLRSMSKTGGALGQVSDKEEAMLANNLAALQTSQSYDSLRESLKQIMDFASQSKRRIASSVEDNPMVQATSPQGKLKSMLTPRGALPNGVTETGVENGKTWYRWASDGRRHTSLPVNP